VVFKRKNEVSGGAVSVTTCSNKETPSCEGGQGGVREGSKLVKAFCGKRQGGGPRGMHGKECKRMCNVYTVTSYGI